MPATTSTVDTVATVHDSSPTARQATMPVTTEPAQAIRRPIECSGWAGPVGPLDGVEEAHRRLASRGSPMVTSTACGRADVAAHGPGQAPAGREAVDDGGRAGAGRLRRGQEDRRAPVE